MSNKLINPNAKEALTQMKLEIANEIGLNTEHTSNVTSTSHDNGVVGGRVGGQMSKRLVELGELALLKQYNNNKN